MPGGTAVPAGQVVNLEGREGERGKGRDGKVGKRREGKEKQRKGWEGKEEEEKEVIGRQSKG